MRLDLARLFIEYSKTHPGLVRQRPDFIHFLSGGMAVKLFLKAHKMSASKLTKKTTDFDFVFAVPRPLTPAAQARKARAMDRMMSRHVDGFSHWLSKNYNLQNTISKNSLVPPIPYNPNTKKRIYKVFQYTVNMPGKEPEGLVDATLTLVPGVRREQLLKRHTAAFGMPIQRVKYLYKGALYMLAGTFSSFILKDASLSSRNPLLGARAEKGLKNAARVANLMKAAKSNATTAARNLLRNINKGNVSKAFNNANRVMKNLRGKKCVNQTEQDVHNHCIASYVHRGWKLVAHEWLVIPGKEEHGRGDLVFAKNKEYRVIECKRVPHPNVFEQAKFYGAAWKMRYARPGYKVRYGVWTCSTKRMLGTVTNPRRLCRRPACRIIFSKYRVR